MESKEQSNKNLSEWTFPVNHYRFIHYYCDKLNNDEYKYPYALTKDEINCTSNILAPLVSGCKLAKLNNINWNVVNKCLAGNVEVYDNKKKQMYDAIYSTLEDPKDIKCFFIDL